MIGEPKEIKIEVTLKHIKDSETILNGEYYVVHSDFIVALEEEIEKLNQPNIIVKVDDIKEVREKIEQLQQELQRKDNIINELKDLCELKKARMLNEKDYSKWYVENYDNAIHTLNLSHSGVMLETIKSAVIKTCDDVLDKIKEIEERK